MMKRAQAKKLVEFNIVNIRDYAKDKHRSVDDSPYGGGPGMIMKVEPIYNALRAIKIKNLQATSPVRNKVYNGASYKLQAKERVILLSAKGKLFTQNDVKRLTKYERIVLICGRYEGVDERVAKYLADEELSIGPYVLTGGELPAMVIIDAVSRHIPGVLGKAESLIEESYTLPKGFKFSAKGGSRFAGQASSFKEYPQYTRPEVFSPKKNVKWVVPKILLSGDHKKIKMWRKKHQK
jgi:tRNA (guanine37-N1)-methyltransferase